MPAFFGSAHDAPGDAVTGVVQAAKGTLQALDIREVVLFGNKDIVHDNLPRNRGPQREFALNLGGGQSFHALFQDKAADHVVVGFCPDDEYVRQRTVADPHLGTG